MRASEPLNILGSQFGLISSFDVRNVTGLSQGFLQPASLYLSSIHWADSLNAVLQPFKSWAELYGGPIASRGDSFTSILRYNFSSDLLENPFTISGYGSRKGLTQPFEAANIVLLHDGYCASTCAVFSDLMRRQAGIKSYVLGGLPRYGPMQPVGGTKGCLLLTFSLMSKYISTVLGTFGTAADRQKWAAILPFPTFAMKTSSSPSTNFRDGLQPAGSGYGDLPVQFLNETANCRLFFTAPMIANVTTIWEAVAADAWGGVSKCVAGSKVEAGNTIPSQTISLTGPTATPSSKSAGVRQTATWAMLTGAVVMAVMVTL
jgi:hypothetical protein